MVLVEISMDVVRPCGEKAAELMLTLGFGGSLGAHRVLSDPEGICVTPRKHF